MKRALVIGGGGYYGAQVVDVLRKLDGLEVYVAGRSLVEGEGRVRLDLLDGTTFVGMGGFDAIINCSDSVGARPDEAIVWAMSKGLVWFEMGAHAPSVERLLALDSGEVGSLVLGVGIFPGISTVMAHDLGEAESVEFGVRLSPLSGSGKSNCDLMAQTLVTPSVRFEGGRRIEGRVVGESLTIPYLGTGEASSAELSLPDAALMHHQQGVEAVKATMALIPGLLIFNFRFLALVVGLLGPLKRAALWFLKWNLVLMRATILRAVNTSVQMTVIADRGTLRERKRQLRIPQGQLATALGVGAAVVRWLEGDPISPGVHTMGQVCTLEASIESMKRLGGKDVEIELA